jgi:Sap, sulfolipid-1-addressing protein
MPQLNGIAMNGIWGSTLSACALVIALSSPIPVMVTVVLLVHNDRPHSSSMAFLSGRVATLAVLATAFMHVPRFLAGLDGPTPVWTTWAIIAAGALLITLGVRQWRQRGRTDRRPSWEDCVARMGPKTSAAAGIFTALNTKVLAVSAAVGTHVGALHSTILRAAAMVAYYAVLANSVVAASILAYLIARPRIEPLLQRLREWMQSQHQALTATLLVVFGCAMVLYGIAGT